MSGESPYGGRTAVPSNNIYPNGDATGGSDQSSRSDSSNRHHHHHHHHHNQLPCIISSCYPITLKFIDVCYTVKVDASSSAKTSSTLLRKMICGTVKPSPRQNNNTCPPPCRRNTAGRSPGEKKILHGITGMVCPGEILAILGPSGGGKSTLLNLLSNRLHNHHDTSGGGSILYNNKKFTKQVQKRTGFVTQDDILYPHLTVKETLVFCALLRLPTSLSKRQKVAVAESVITELGLSKCEDTVIGNGFIRGVSGGERKRVSIAHEMLIDPSLLICDEPTSGLDSTAAYNVVGVLNGLVKKKGKTVVMAVHQPSSRVFMMFDKVLVLSEGRCVYFGKGEEVFGYLKDGVGFIPSFPMNPADFLLDLASGICHNIDGLAVSEGQKPNVKQTLISSYNNVLAPKVKAACLEEDSTTHYDNNAAVAPTTAISPTTTTTTISSSPTAAASSNDTAVMLKIGSRGKHRREFRTQTYRWFNQFIILFQRSLKERRYESFNSLRILQVIAASILSGAMWWHSDYKEIQDRLGLLYFISIFWGVFPSFNAVFAFPQDRAMLIKERASGMYTLSSYFMARVVGDIPMELILPTIFMTLTYWMTGLTAEFAAFVLTLSVLIGYVLVAQGLGLALGAIIMDAKRASTIATITMLAFVLTGGYYVHEVPGCLAWIKYVSITFYAYRLLIRVQYGTGDAIWALLGCYDRTSMNRGGERGTASGNNYDDYNLAAACKLIEEDIGGQISPLTCIGALVIMFIGYRLLAFLALKRMKM